MEIKRYNDKYRDDMIFMYLSAKNALGRIPKLREDLLNIEDYFFKNNGYFWLALNDEDRVIGCIGLLPQSEDSAVIKHLFVMPEIKRNGIGTKLLLTLENYAKEKKIKELTLHLGNIKYYYESRYFYKSKGYIEYKPDYMKKILD